MRKPDKACVLISGGSDSAVLVKWALGRHNAVFPVFIRGGLRWEKAELYWLKKFLRTFTSRRLRPLTILDVPLKNLYTTHWSLSGHHIPGRRSADSAVYLPGRNLLLLSLGSVFCAQQKIPWLLLGTLKGNPFSDSTHLFLKTLQKASRTALRFPLSIRTPFSRLTKKEVLRFGHDLPLPLTFSCLSPRGTRPCGRCNKCAERFRALGPWRAGGTKRTKTNRQA